MLDGTTENFFFLSCNNIFKVTSMTLKPPNAETKFRLYLAEDIE